MLTKEIIPRAAQFCAVSAHQKHPHCSVLCRETRINSTSFTLNANAIFNVLLPQFKLKGIKNDSGSDFFIVSLIFI